MPPVLPFAGIAHHFFLNVQRASPVLLNRTKPFLMLFPLLLGSMKRSKRFSALTDARDFAGLLRLYQKEFIQFSSHGREQLFCYCAECTCPVVVPITESKSRKRPIGSDGFRTCGKCQRDAYNRSRREANFKDEHCDPSNTTNFASLLKSPKKRRLTARLQYRKGEVSALKKREKRVHKLLAVFQSKENQVEHNVPWPEDDAEDDATGDPGPVRGVTSMILDTMRREDE